MQLATYARVQDLGKTAAGEAALQHLWEHVARTGVCQEQGLGSRYELEHVLRACPPQCMDGELRASGRVQGFNTGRGQFMRMHAAAGEGDTLANTDSEGTTDFSAHVEACWTGLNGAGTFTVLDGQPKVKAATLGIRVARSSTSYTATVKDDGVSCSTADDWVWDVLCAYEPTG